MKRPIIALITPALTGILLLGIFWASAAQADSVRKFTLEVAMGDAPSGINFQDVPPFPPPGRGAVVLASGNIFPEGTLDSDSDPNSPDAIGIWRCQLVSLGPDDFSDFGLTGAVTYFFQLNGTGYDRIDPMIIVQGLNSHPSIPGTSPPLPDVDKSVPRVHAVVGGTGRFARVRGEVREKVIGTNTMGRNRNLRFKFRLHRVEDDD